MKVTGTVVFKDLETGVWVLEGDDGKTYELAGGDRKIKKNGQRIEAEGDVDRGGAGIAMVGPVFAVKRYKAL
jgi:cob(I)alamin adenosyltransferase